MATREIVSCATTSDEVASKTRFEASRGIFALRFDCRALSGFRYIRALQRLSHVISSNLALYEGPTSMSAMRFPLKVPAKFLKRYIHALVVSWVTYTTRCYTVTNKAWLVAVGSDMNDILRRGPSAPTLTPTTKQS
jgi:hypothetical protein